MRVELGDTIVSLSEPELFPVTLKDGQQVALTPVADMTQSASYPSIIRKNGMAVARIQGKIDRATTTSGLISAVVTDELAPQFAKTHPGIIVQIGGATREQQRSQASMMVSLLLGLIGVYMVLAVQFRSYSLPLVVMLSIPFALIGTILVVLVFPAVLSIYFDVFSVRKWVGKFAADEDPPQAASAATPPRLAD